MLFNSLEYLIFLPGILALYFVLPHMWQNKWLLLASYAFYGWWDWRFLGLILISTLVDYLCGRKLETTDSPHKRKVLLATSVIVNLGILGTFKYFNFFVDSAASILSVVGFDPHMPVLKIILPVGISFYTFQTMAYTIDVYRRNQKVERNFLDFALYVSFFPQLVAGPIERPSRLLPQIKTARTVSWEDIKAGSFLLFIGFFKKLVISDAVISEVALCFGRPEDNTVMQLVAGMFLFVFQVYGDFSGYSDIARGSARLLGFNLVRNFEQPYLSTSLTELWQRWHVSLATWLRDYLYIPLGGNQKGRRRTYINIFLTMFLGGLWHGAAWTYVIWGSLHGIGLAIERWWTRERKNSNASSADPPGTKKLLPKLIAGLCVFMFWSILAILFRAESWDVAIRYLECMLFAPFTSGAGVSGLGDPSVLLLPLLMGCFVLMMDIPQYITDDHQAIRRWPILPRVMVYTVMLASMFLFDYSPAIPFIYFQF